AHLVEMSQGCLASPMPPGDLHPHSRGPRNAMDQPPKARRASATPSPAGLIFPRRIISGGDTGVSRAALDWAIANGIEHDGWCSAGRKAEDGIIPLSYRLQEVRRSRSGPNIRPNVLCSDAMLLLNLGVLDGWTYRTVGICQRAKKAFRIVQLENVEDAMVRAVRSWLLTDQIAVLYVTGPRAR